MDIFKLKTKAELIFKTLITIAIIILVAVPASDVYAGDINSAESRVINVASGTFTYEGKVYKAYSTYVNQLYSYMSQDDVNLTESQADKVINYIYSNVQQGIDSGYVYEVKAPEENNTDLDKVKADQEADGEKANKQAKDSSDKEIEAMFEEMDEDAKNRADSKPKASETDASIIMLDDSIVVTSDDGETVITYNDRIIPGWFGTTLIIIGAAALVINALVFMLLTLKGCMRFKRRDRSRPKKGHRARRKIRKACRRVLTCTTAVSVTTAFIILAIAIGLYNNNKIIGNIQSSGYFRYSYTEYLTEVANSDTKTEPESYDEFLINEKKALDQMEASTLSRNRSLAPYISRMQTDMKASLIIAAIILILAIAVANVCNIFMDQRRDRGIKSIAVSTIIGTVLTLLLAVGLSILNIQDGFFIEPDYLYSFIGLHLKWCLKMLTIIGLFGAVISMSLVGLYRSKRKDRS